MSRPDDDGATLRQLIHASGLPGFARPADNDDASGDQMAAAGRSVAGLKTGASLAPQKSAAARPVPAPQKPAPAPARAVTPSPAPAAVRPAQPTMAALPLPAGRYIKMTGLPRDLDRFQAAAGMPSAHFRDAGPNGKQTRAWRQPDDGSATRGVVGSALKHGLGVGVGTLNSARFKATGPGANDGIPAATLNRLRTS